MQAPISLRIELTGNQRTGTSNKSGTPRQYFILSAFANLPGVKYPQACEIFTFDASAVKPAGLYDVPLVASIKDGRPAFDLDFSAAQPVKAA